MTEEVEVLNVELTMFPPDSDEIEVRTIALGANPMILIEPIVTDDEEYGFSLTSSLISQEDIASVLETLVSALRNGEEV